MKAFEISLKQPNVLNAMFLVTAGEDVTMEWLAACLREYGHIRIYCFRQTRRGDQVQLTFDRERLIMEHMIEMIQPMKGDVKIV